MLAAALLLCLTMGTLGYVGKRTFLFMALWAALWLAALILVVWTPRDWSTRRLALGLLLAGSLARLLFLPQQASDDVFRYIWEGRVVLNGQSPYSLTPLDPTLEPLRDSAVWPYINHPDLAACYPPLILLLFSVIAWLWYDPITIKLVMLAADLGVLAILIRLLHIRRQPLRLAWLYVFNPVCLFAFSAEGHLDAIQVLFLALALLLHAHKKWGAMFACLGLAIQAKYFAVLAAPFFLNRSNLRHAWVAALCTLLPFAWFLPRDGWRVFQSLAVFGSSMAYNGSIHAVLRWFMHHAIFPASLTCGVLLMLTLCAVTWYNLSLFRGFMIDPARGALAALGALLLLSPTMHYWYLTWLIPLFIVRRSWAWWMLCLTVGASFEVMHNMHYAAVWRLSAAYQWAEWLPFFAVLVPTLRLTRRWLPRRRLAPNSVSVVIPALNEANVIGDCLDVIQTNEQVTQIIVVDAGSQDGTGDIARERGAEVLVHDLPFDQGGGRGGQLDIGVQHATGDVIVIVHADTLIEPDTCSRILEALAAHPDAVGGAVGGRFTPGSRTCFTTLLNWANDLRAEGLGISFGDQVQFFRRKDIVDDQAFPNQPLMEDVELALDLRARGKTLYLWGNVRISSRKWQRNCLKRALHILRLSALYTAQRLWRKPDTAAMYRSYYSDS